MMNEDRVVLGTAGTMVLAGTLLSILFSPWFFVLPVFVGMNMIQASFTRFCPLVFALRKAGVARGGMFR